MFRNWMIWILAAGWLLSACAVFPGDRLRFGLTRA